ncbi:hypothetical protein FE257_008064 [Aspergillus nanangensis]|uniref:Uncharacterized protein n=1 Tax=Aspergillus nanangensis TaxID=2582783 RepID=A0AAD4CMI8_ASPNN|nr:hypothetical protein FE257_008064 [Aspergillus nanangensis]
MTSLNGKVICITGSASGMGLELARLAGRQGARLALADISQGPLDKLVRELQDNGVDVIGTVLDVSSSAQVNNWVESTVKHYGRLDGAANLAGVVGRNHIIGQLEELPDAEWNFILGVNLTGIMYCVRAQLRVMQRGAAIVNAASVAGAVGQPNMCAYAVSKHGVVGLTRSVAKEVGPRGIRVNCIGLGGVDTPMLQTVHGEEGAGLGPLSNVPMQRAGTPEELAKAFAFLLGDDSSYVSGAHLLVDGGLLA